MCNYPVNGIILPDELLADDELTLTAKVILQLIRREISRGRTLEEITKRELAERIAVSVDTIKRAKRELRCKGCLTNTSSAATKYSNGIGLSDELLADRRIYLSDKIVFGIIQRAVNKGKNSASITSRQFSEQIGIGKRTVPDILNRLKKAGYIAVVLNTTVLKKPMTLKTLTKQRPTTFRYIYLDKRKAGHCKRKISESKKPVEMLYSFYVLEKGMSPEAYVKMMKRLALEERQREEAEEHWRMEQHNREFYGTCTDEQIEEMERDEGSRAGIYRKYKREYLKEQARIKENEKETQADVDCLFDD